MTFYAVLVSVRPVSGRMETDHRCSRSFQRPFVRKVQLRRCGMTPQYAYVFTQSEAAVPAPFVEAVATRSAAYRMSKSCTRAAGWRGVGNWSSTAEKNRLEKPLDPAVGPGWSATSSRDRPGRRRPRRNGRNSSHTQGRRAAADVGARRRTQARPHPLTRVRFFPIEGSLRRPAGSAGKAALSHARVR